MDKADKTTDTDLERWREEELRRRIREEDEERVEKLRPPDAFPALYAPRHPDATGRRGPESPTVEGVLTSSCCGWSRRPDAREFFEALRADRPTSRQLAVGCAFINEADIDQILTAHLEGAFTWRQLALLMHRSGRATGRRSTPLITYLNRRAGSV